MKGNVRDILIGIAILAIVLGGIYLIRRNTSTPLPLPSPTPISEFEQNLKNQFNITVPDNVQKANLKDVSGGKSAGEGLATRIFENGKFVFTVLANLPDPQPGYLYQIWLVKGSPTDPDYNVVSMGSLRLAKGGYLLDSEGNIDYSDHGSVIVTLEKTVTKVPGQHILEGSF